MPTISVIVPVYKVEPYIHQCIDSILAQTYTDFELILVDDGSPDNCGLICDEYAKQDDRIRVIHQENRGLSAARNAGIDVAKGEYLTFIDSDDWITAHYLEKLYTAAINTDADIVCCDYFSKQSVANDNSTGAERIRIISGRDALAARYSGDVQVRVSAWGKLYRRSILEKLSFPEGKIHEDQWFSTMAYYFAKKTAFLQNKLYFYRLRDDSITGSEFSIKRFDNIELMDQVIHVFRTNNDVRLTKLASIHREKTCAQYVLIAKSKQTGQIPSQFEMSKMKALAIIYRYLPKEKFKQYFQMAYPQFEMAHKFLYCVKQDLFYKG